MESENQTSNGQDPAVERMEFCRLFNDPKIRQESTLKVMPSVPEPVFHGHLPKGDVQKWIAWNVGSLLSTRGVKASVGVKKVVHGASDTFAIDIFINQKGSHEDYRIIVRPFTASFQLSILNCTEESKGQPTVRTPMGEISMVTWSSSVVLDADLGHRAGGGGGAGRLRRL